MFDNLSEKLQRVFKNLRGEGKLSAENMERRCAKSAWRCSKPTSISRLSNSSSRTSRSKAMGEEVLTALSPSQQVVKIVHEELIKILGSHESKLRFANDPPSVFLIVGLQGSGKTTTTGKLARWLSRNGHRPMVVSVDVYRPAAREQLKVMAREVGQPIYEGVPGENLPLDLARSARRESANTGRDVLLVDTAGRLHIDDELMGELQQLKEQLNPVEILFVADAMTGQDAVKSADEFHKRLGITGVILTKMDGDARGGGGSLHPPRHRPAAEIRGCGREVRRAGAVPSRPRGQPHPGHGRHPVVHREGQRADRPEEGRGDAAQAHRQRVHAGGFPRPVAIRKLGRSVPSWT
jgi:signal recognition particle subunit SRP54